MTAKLVACLALASGLSVGCDRDSQPTLTFPFNVPPPATSVPVELPVPVVTERWNLAETYAGHSGPPDCITPFDRKASTPIESVIRMLRSGESIEVWTAGAQDYYVGTIAGDGFLASESYEEPRETWLCGERGRFHYRVEAYLSGHFSGDGRALTGEAVAQMRLESGDTITRRWAWNAQQIE